MHSETGPMAIEIEGEISPLPGLAGSAGLLGPGGLPTPTWSSFGRADRKLLRIYRDFRIWLAYADRTGYLARVVGYPGFNASRAARRQELEEERARLSARREALIEAGGDPAEAADLQSRMEQLSMEQMGLTDVKTYFFFPDTNAPKRMVGYGLAAFALQLLGVVLALGVYFLFRQSAFPFSSDIAVSAIFDSMLPGVWVFWSVVGLLCLWRGIVERRRYFRSIRSSLADNAIFAAFTRATGQ